MIKAQEKIKEIIKTYITLFNVEYRLFTKQQRELREGLINEFAANKGDNLIERRLFDVPATLHTMLIEKLDGENLKYFKSKEGARWFAKSFKEFRTAQKI